MLNIILREYKQYTNKDRKNSFIYALLCLWRVPHFRVIVYIRIMQETRFKLIKELLSRKLCLRYGIEIGINTKIGSKLLVRHINGIVIGDGVTIGESVTLYHGVTLGQRNGKYPTVLNGVTIYPNATLLGEIVIGKNSMIMANSVVLSDVPDNCIVAGQPAHVVKNLGNN